jgi:iron complex transport system substrate-binding protein
MSNYLIMLKLKRLKVFIWIFTLTILLFPGCRTSVESGSNDAGTENSGAKRFSLEIMDGYTELRIFNPWQGANNITQIYKLVKKGYHLPKGSDSSSVIYVPLKKIICMSTTHLAMISAIGEEKSVTGVSGAGFIYSDKLVELVRNGSVVDVGYEANLNKELILKISPDLIMMYGIGSESAGYVSKLKELGIKVVFNADYLESDPLSKAEWIKLFGALYCKEKLADSIFQSEVRSYNKLKAFLSTNISSKPSVLLGLPYKDTWYISPGNSFISKLIADAGGNYIWRNTDSSVSMPYGLENVYLKAMDAEYWLNIGSAKSKAEIISIDMRLADLPCFKNGKLYNNNNRITENDGNDYWESGTVYPHLILKDIALILHPELFKGEELYYYKKIN